MIKVLIMSAVWCNPCKLQNTILEEVKLAVTDVDFEAVDIDQSPDKAKEFSVMSVPTLVFVKDGVEVGRIVGVHKAAKIIAKIEELQ